MRDSRRTRLVLVLLLLIGFVLITLDFRGGESSPVRLVRDAGARIFGPIESGAAAVAEPVQNAVRDLASAWGSQERIEALERENARLRAQLRSREVSQRRAGELNELLSFAGRGRLRIVPAHVIAVRGALGFEHTATLDAGSRDGVEQNMTVVTGDGLVGRVVHVGPGTSTVLLAIDRSSHVGARMENSGEIGVTQGAGMGSMRLELLNSHASLGQGDRLVTFGSQGGEPYVPGIPVGTVASTEVAPGALLQHAQVRPFVDFSTLDTVGVVVEQQSGVPRDALLPPKPDSSGDGGGQQGGQNGGQGGQGNQQGRGESAAASQEGG